MNATGSTVSDDYVLFAAADVCAAAGRLDLAERLARLAGEIAPPPGRAEQLKSALCALTAHYPAALHGRALARTIRADVLAVESPRPPAPHPKNALLREIAELSIGDVLSEERIRKILALAGLSPADPATQAYDSHSDFREDATWPTLENFSRR